MPTPFITIAELTDKLGESAATSRGTAVINAASDMVRTFTELTLNPVGTATISLDGTGTDALLLPERPVLNAGTVIESGTTLTLDEDYEIGDRGVVFRLPGVIDNGWGVETLRTYWWPGRQNIEVTYEYGYATVPGDLKEVALSFAARLHQVQTSAIEEEESLGQYSHRTRYASDGSGSDLTNTERLILRKYR